MGLKQYALLVLIFSQYHCMEIKIPEALSSVSPLNEEGSLQSSNLESPNSIIDSLPTTQDFEFTSTIPDQTKERHTISHKGQQAKSIKWWILTALFYIIVVFGPFIYLKFPLIKHRVPLNEMFLQVGPLPALPFKQEDFDLLEKVLVEDIAKWNETFDVPHRTPQDLSGQIAFQNRIYIKEMEEQADTRIKTDKFPSYFTKKDIGTVRGAREFFFHRKIQPILKNAANQGVILLRDCVVGVQSRLSSEFSTSMPALEELLLSLKGLEPISIKIPAEGYEEPLKVAMGMHPVHENYQMAEYFVNNINNIVTKLVTYNNMVYLYRSNVTAWMNKLNRSDQFLLYESSVIHEKFVKIPKEEKEALRAARQQRQ